MNKVAREFDFKGIKRIEIPKQDIDFVNELNSKQIIRKYLPIILATHQKNAEKEQYLYNYMLGLQDIIDKTRLYDKDAENNNKQVENHAFRQVDFKVGFLTGEKREYTHKADSNSDDLIYLDRYFTDCGFYAKDKELKTWIYATGIGVTHCEPRTDIIISGDIDTISGRREIRYATREDGFDINFEAPFNFSTLEPTENFVVYSSSRSKEPLFCVSIVEVDVSDEDAVIPDIRKEIYIETRYHYFKIQSDKLYTTFFNELETEKVKMLHYLPMVEHSVNKARLGIIELNKDQFDAINTLKSSTSDMIVDGANVILVFKNTDITADQVKEMKKAGAVLISDPVDGNHNSTADLDTIKLEIPFEGLNAYYEETLTQSYDIAGVPLASGSVTSGGDTGQARLLGGGWNNAYIIINNNITSLLEYDYEVLKLILLFCRQVPQCPLNELYASQIDIKYRINQNDNLLVKAQAMAQLYNINLPKKYVLKAGGLFNDITTVEKDWDKNDTKIKAQEETTNERITVTEDSGNITTTQQGNNSQE